MVHIIEPASNPNPHSEYEISGTDSASKYVYLLTFHICTNQAGGVNQETVLILIM